MRSISSWKVLCIVLVSVVALCIPETEGANSSIIQWVLEETSYTRLCSTKKILTVNGLFPGPSLNLTQGQTVKVNVTNQGTYGVTIHWHGVKQPGNPWSDGPEYVAQCPIKPGASFTYEIILSDEIGTLWWHAHSDWTRATVHGAIYVNPKSGKFPFPKPDAEIPIFLASWYKGSVMQVIEDALASGGEVNTSDAFTINGQPGDTQPCSAENMTTITVDHNKTYLLRIVNGILNEEMFFMIAGHKLTVVGIDGAYVKQIVTNYIMITPGQTMDVLLQANQNRSHYYMASRAFGELIFSNATTTAMVEYSGNYTPPTNASFPTLPDYNSSTAANEFARKFRALNTTDVPQTVNKRIFMTLSIGTLPCAAGKTCSGPRNNSLSASLNNVTFGSPTIDVLQAYYTNKTDVYKTDFPLKPDLIFNWTMSPMPNNFTMFSLNGTRIIELDYNETVELVFQGTNVLNSAENHPMHLHGYSYYVVGWGHGNFNETESPKGYNLLDPPEMNTIGVPLNGWTAVRFKANNPGVWFMHCHLERHASWGMATVFIVKNGPTQATSMKPPPAYLNPC